MDPYGDHNRKILSPLDKIDNMKKEEGLTSSPEPKIPSDILTTAEEEQGQESTENEPSLVDHLTDLRKQLVKSVADISLFSSSCLFNN